MEAPVRTTLDLNDALLRRAKVEAARAGKTLTRYIEEGMALRLAQTEPPGEPPPEPFRWRVFGDPNAPKIDTAEYERRLREADDEWAMRQAGLLPFRDPDAPDGPAE